MEKDIFLKELLVNQLPNFLDCFAWAARQALKGVQNSLEFNLKTEAELIVIAGQLALI